MLSSNDRPKKNVLIMMSGSIACYKVCFLISKLVQNQYEVKVVMTESASKFVGQSTIEGLTKNKVHSNTFEAGQAMEHIYLDRWADLILVAPATANTINKLSQGVGDDLLTTLFLAHDFKKPFLLAPAMNTQMYLHPSTQRSIDYLKSIQVHVLEAASGILACGEIGYGKLLEPELLFKEIESKLSNTDTSKNTSLNLIKNKQRKVLITSGGTQEPIDDVRVITNKSTGQTAAFMANIFISSGYEVTYLSARTAVKPDFECDIHHFSTFKDLEKSLSDLLKENYDYIIHTAAVSDYSVIPTAGKIDSSQQIIHLTLNKNPKLINTIKENSPLSKLIGFKLTSNLNEIQIQDKVNELFNKSGCDFIVHNDWKNVHTENHVFNLYSKNSKTINNINLTDLSYQLIELFQKNSESI